MLGSTKQQSHSALWKWPLMPQDCRKDSGKKIPQVGNQMPCLLQKALMVSRLWYAQTALNCSTMMRSGSALSRLCFKLVGLAWERKMECCYFARVVPNFSVSGHKDSDFTASSAQLSCDVLVKTWKQSPEETRTVLDNMFQGLILTSKGWGLHQEKKPHNKPRKGLFWTKLK